MWVNRQFFDLVLADNKKQEGEIRERGVERAVLSAQNQELRAQKAKDDITIDWMRHRINALEKTNAVLLAKAAGVHVPVPEIVPTRPGSISALPAGFDHLPSFEDVGDQAAIRLGVMHDEAGNIEYTNPEKVFEDFKRRQKAEEATAAATA